MKSFKLSVLGMALALSLPAISGNAQVMVGGAAMYSNVVSLAYG